MATRMLFLCLSLLAIGVQSQSTDAALLMVGGTGVGKSTFIDLLAGGQEIAPVGYASGDLKTRNATVFHLEHLQGHNDSDAPWTVIDTPGLQNTHGNNEEDSLVDVEDIETALHKVALLDAVVLAFKYDSKMTDQAMDPFLFLHSNFGPNIWRRVIVVYTFWPWAENCFGEFSALTGRSCSCKTQEDLSKFHAEVMNGAFNYMKGRLEKGLVRCSESLTRDCFPAAQDMPHVGSNLDLHRLQVGHERGFNLLDPADQFYVQDEKCAGGTNAAAELKRFQTLVVNMKSAEDYKPLITRDIALSWMSCQKAVRELRSAGCCSDHPLAGNIKDCIKGGTIKDVDDMTLHIRESLNGMLQQRIAFALDEPSLVVPGHGFSDNNCQAVRTYPDFRTSMACKTAMGRGHSPVVASDFVDCWQRLRLAGGKPAGAPEAIQHLNVSFQHRMPHERVAIRKSIIDNGLCSTSSSTDCPPIGMCTDACNGFWGSNNGTSNFCGHVECSQDECGCSDKKVDFTTIVAIITIGVLSCVVILYRVIQEQVSPAKAAKASGSMGPLLEGYHT